MKEEKSTSNLFCKTGEETLGTYLQLWSMNHERLTGMHETQAMDKFSYGLSESWCVDSYSSFHGRKMDGKAIWKTGARLRMLVLTWLQR